jgi:hypothetical protein
MSGEASCLPNDRTFLSMSVGPRRFGISESLSATARSDLGSTLVVRGRANRRSHRSQRTSLHRTHEGHLLPATYKVRRSVRRKKFGALAERMRQQNVFSTCNAMTQSRRYFADRRLSALRRPRFAENQSGARRSMICAASARAACAVVDGERRYIGSANSAVSPGGAAPGGRHRIKHCRRAKGMAVLDRSR